MKKIVSTLLLVILLFSYAGSSEAFWIWSPDIGKWMNPKKNVKDTPEEQFQWAMAFFGQKEWDRAIEEFEKISDVFPNSRLAAEGVYYSGLCWEAKDDLAKAADAYQRLIDRYPYSDRIKDAVKREFDIANEFAGGGKVKVLGIPALPGQEKAVELYKHIVKNAPFGTLGDQAQFNLAEVYKMRGEYEEAQKAYQQVVDEYPNSELVSKARYQIAYTSMQASKKAQYNERYADRAIEEFQGFKNSFPKNEEVLEADESIKALRAKKAEASFETALFYEKQRKFKSAKVYYEAIVQKYPETSVAQEAKKRIAQILQEESQPEAKPGLHLW